MILGFPISRRVKFKLDTSTTTFKIYITQTSKVLQFSKYFNNVQYLHLFLSSLITIDIMQGIPSGVGVGGPNQYLPREY